VAVVVVVVVIVVGKTFETRYVVPLFHSSSCCYSLFSIPVLSQQGSLSMYQLPSVWHQVPSLLE